MSKRPRGQVRTIPKETPLREWAQHGSLPVTRSEALQVFQILITRRFETERILRERRVWYRRLWRWLKDRMGTERHTLTPAQEDEARAQATDPSRNSVEVGP